MNELECRNDDCENVVCCDEGVVNVRCGYCCATMSCDNNEYFYNNYNNSNYFG